MFHFKLFKLFEMNVFTTRLVCAAPIILIAIKYIPYIISKFSSFSRRSSKSIDNDKKCNSAEKIELSCPSGYCFHKANCEQNLQLSDLSDYDSHPAYPTCGGSKHKGVDPPEDEINALNYNQDKTAPGEKFEQASENREDCSLKMNLTRQIKLIKDQRLRKNDCRSEKDQVLLREGQISSGRIKLREMMEKSIIESTDKV